VRIPPDGDQLGLWRVGSLELPALPWGGQSPRVLTAAYVRFTLKAQAKKSVSEFACDENQFDLWLPVKKAPWKYQGAPLLDSLEEG